MVAVAAPQLCRGWALQYALGQGQLRCSQRRPIHLYQGPSVRLISLPSPSHQCPFSSRSQMLAYIHPVFTQRVFFARVPTFHCLVFFWSCIIMSHQICFQASSLPERKSAWSANFFPTRLFVYFESRPKTRGGDGLCWQCPLDGSRVFPGSDGSRLRTQFRSGAAVLNSTLNRHLSKCLEVAARTKSVVEARKECDGVVKSWGGWVMHFFAESEWFS